MKRTAFVASAALALIGAAAANAGVTLNLGGGWEAEITNADVLDLEVDFVNLNQNILVIEKFANFRNLESLDIIFRQTADDQQTVSRIVITDEFVINSSGVGWSSFNMSLLGGTAMFNEAASADFSFDPFTARNYSGSSTQVSFSDGFVNDGDIWTPGLANGGLVIDVDLSGTAPAVFTLRETPVPAPGAIAVLAIAGFAGRRRRRR